MKKWRWLFGFAALALLCGGAVWWNSRDAYTRYVSPPLKDGTRYTFLYPSRMTQVTISRNQSGPTIAVSEPYRRPNALGELLIAVRASPPPTQEVSVIAVFSEPLSQVSGVVPRDKRGSVWRDVFLLDKQSRCAFIMHHWERRDQKERFNRQTDIVARSFRILPPDAPVPSP